MSDYTELYEGLTQLERIAWDLAENGTFVSCGDDYGPRYECVCGYFDDSRDSLWTRLDQHEDDCPYRRAVEWRARLVAEWEAEHD